MAADARRAWLHIANVQFSPRLAALLLEHFDGDPLAILAASDAELEQAGCPPPPLARLRDAAFAPTPHQEAWLDRPDVVLLWQAHPDYPRILRDIPASPPILFARGQLSVLEGLSVGIVGSRRATPYGRSVAHKLARELAGHGLTVVSGGAVGIDAAAHQGALDGGGPTVAIVGCGLDVDYPHANKALFERIVTQGVILTEYPFGSQPESWRFPQRNRLISGLSQGTVVVEAPQSSGALNTVRHALEQGRTVMTVPGNIDRPSSVGTNTLLKEGATPITQTEDILRALNMVVLPPVVPQQHAFDMPFAAEDAMPVQRAGTASGTTNKNAGGTNAGAGEAGPNAPRASLPSNASDPQRKLLSYLSLTPRHIDAVAKDAGMTATQAGVEMTLMELSGMVRRLPGNNYIRAL